MATNYFENIKEKLLDLIYEEFGHGEVQVLKEDNLERYGTGKTQIILDTGEIEPINRLGGFYIDNYNVPITVRRRIVNDENIDRDLMILYEKTKERLTERNANRNQQANGLWFDARIASVDPPQNVNLAEGSSSEDEDDITDIAREVTFLWVGSIGYCPTTGL